LRAVSADCDAKLQAAMAQTRDDQVSIGQSATVVLRDRAGEKFVPVTVTALPEITNGLLVQARVLLVIGRNRHAEPTPALKDLGLTGAEADVVVKLLGGASPIEIARQRSVSEQTVRAQFKSIYQKLGVHRQSELFDKLRPLI